MPPSRPSTPLPPPPPPSDPFAAAAAAYPASPVSTQLPPPSYTYSDPYAPPPSNSYFDPLAPSSSSSQPFDFSSVLTADGYPSLTYSDLNNLGFPENYQLYSANDNNFLSHPNGPNHQSNYQTYAAGNTSLSLENNQLYAGNSFFFSTENSQPYAANATLSHENCQPYAANTSIILSHEYQANNSLSPDSDDDDDEADDAGNNDNYYFALPYQHHPLPYNWRETLPVGVKFRPTDGELIVYYLEPHIRRGATPPGGPVTTDRDVYDYTPQQLLELGEDHGDGRRYFIFAARKIGRRKTDRIITTKAGYWRPTQATKPVFFGTKYGYKEVGEKRPLAFYIETSENEKKKSVKTQWLMQELTLPKNENDDAASSSSSSSKHHLEFVVAIVYYNHRRQR